MSEPNQVIINISPDIPPNNRVVIGGNNHNHNHKHNRLIKCYQAFCGLPLTIKIIIIFIILIFLTVFGFGIYLAHDLIKVFS